MKIIAILDRSEGNASVGEEWQETASFDENTPVVEIIDWACSRNNTFKTFQFKANLKLAIDQNSNEA